MNPLKLFYDNENERESVRLFMVECLKEMAVEKTFEGDDVSGIKEARQLVEKTFDKLEELYGNKAPKVVSDSR